MGLTRHCPLGESHCRKGMPANTVSWELTPAPEKAWSRTQVPAALRALLHGRDLHACRRK